MALEKAEFGGEDGLVVIDVECSSGEVAEDVKEFIADQLVDEYGYERFR